MRKQTHKKPSIFKHLYFFLFKLNKQSQNKNKKCNDNGKNIRHVNSLIDHRKRGNEARIQMNKNIILIILN